MQSRFTFDDNRLKAVLYARVSWEKQRFGYGLQTQLDEGRAYAQQRNYEVVGAFSDEYTGESLDRPALNELRDFVERNHVDVLILHDIDRFARSMIYFMLLEEEFRRQGIRVEYVSAEFEDSEEGQLQKQIRALAAEYERQKIMERSKRGIRGKVRSGYVNVGARPPYGYRVRSEPHKTWLEIDEEEATIVRLVFQWYTQGDEDGNQLSIAAIARRLTVMEIPTRGDKVAHVAKKQKKCIWTDAMIRHILTCETYTGVWYYGKTQIVKDERLPRRKPWRKQSVGTKQVPRPREEWLAVSVPAFIDRASFEAAQERLAENVRVASSKRRTNYLLSRRLRCANCGYTLRGSTNKGQQFYICNSRHKELTDCAMPRFRCDLVDETIWQWLSHILQDPELIAAGAHEKQESGAKITKLLQERLRIIKDMLKDTEKQLSLLLDLYVEQNVSKEMYLERKLYLERRHAELTYEKADVVARLETSAFSAEHISAIETFNNEMGEATGMSAFEYRRRYLALLDVYGTVAIENNERVVYITCQLGKQRLSLEVISHF